MYERKPEPRFTTVVLTLLIVISIIATMTMLGCVDEDLGYTDEMLMWEKYLQDVTVGISELEVQVKVLQDKVTELQDDTESTPEEREEAIADLMSQISGLMKKAEELRDSLNDLNWDFLKGEKGKKEEGNSSLDAVETQLTAMTTDLEVLLEELKKEQETDTTDDPVEDDGEPDDQEAQQTGTNTSTGGNSGSGSSSGSDSGSGATGGTTTTTCPGCNEQLANLTYPHTLCRYCREYYCADIDGREHLILEECGHWYCNKDGNHYDINHGCWDPECPGCSVEVGHDKCGYCGKCTYFGKHNHEEQNGNEDSQTFAEEPSVCDKCGLIFNSTTHGEMGCGHIRCVSLSEPEHSFHPCGIHYSCQGSGENHPADQSCN